MTLCAQDQGYENLANAIIKDVAQEYMTALRRLRRRKSRYWEDRRAAALKFFYSEWFGVLSHMDPEALIEKLEREALA